MARPGFNLLRRGTWLFSMLRRRRHFVSILRLIWRLFRDRRVPLHLKGMLILALAYVVSPLDFIPATLLLAIGVVDDIAIVLMAVNYFLQWAPKEIVDEHVETMEPDFKDAFRQGNAF